MKKEVFGSLTRKILLIGLVVMIAGIAFINWLIFGQGIVFNALSASLLWMIVILLIMVAALLDEVNVELKEIYREQIEEVKLLRAELNLLRFDMAKLLEKGSKK